MRIKPLREEAGECGGHVLDNNHRNREVSGQIRQDLRQGVRAASRASDGNNVNCACALLLPRLGWNGNGRPEPDDMERSAFPRLSLQSALIFGISCSRMRSLATVTLPTLEGLVT